MEFSATVGLLQPIEKFSGPSRRGDGFESAFGGTWARDRAIGFGNCKEIGEGGRLGCSGGELGPWGLVISGASKDDAVVAGSTCWASLRRSDEAGLPGEKVDLDSI
ncbi:unnamed protein product [Calypogeia fissa]